MSKQATIKEVSADTEVKLEKENTTTNNLVTIAIDRESQRCYSQLSRTDSMDGLAVRNGAGLGAKRRSGIVEFHGRHCWSCSLFFVVVVIAATRTVRQRHCCCHTARFAKRSTC